MFKIKILFGHSNLLSPTGNFKRNLTGFYFLSSFGHQFFLRSSWKIELNLNIFMSTGMVWYWQDHQTHCSSCWHDFVISVITDIDGCLIVALFWSSFISIGYRVIKLTNEREDCIMVYHHLKKLKISWLFSCLLILMLDA